MTTYNHYSDGEIFEMIEDEGATYFFTEYENPNKITLDKNSHFTETLKLVQKAAPAWREAMQSIDQAMRAYESENYDEA